MPPIRVLVSGSGHMGREVLQAVAAAEDLEPVGVLEKFSKEEFHSLPGGSDLIPMGHEPEPLIGRCRPDVVIDFTNAEWTPRVAKAALAAGARLVIGTTGLSEAFLRELERECRARKLGAFVAPNFAIGAVLMMHMAAIASRYFDWAEITEMHQERKVDAPSGTAVTTARMMAQARGKSFQHNEPEKQTLPGSRGATYEGIAIHSVRLPGLVAHQEVVFGGLGQTLTIRHDSTGRESFIPGVLLATREVMKRQELVVGLENLIGL
ncbi:MAG TPA: 4-hydroxy-tetrahydrodipicolinate reductase [Dehalococcoidia bacterium]|nr:4-hydroxy-tetrahydrodipicolinate reductase [Dehalococcoidia bacterium]